MSDATYPPMICFLVDGNPIPKQSTRFDGHGHAHTAPRVKAWAQQVSARAREVMQGREPIAGEVAVRLVFVLKTKRVIDCDNLSKNVLDSLKNIVFEDDSNVVNLHIVKHYMPKAQPGVMIEVHPGHWLPFAAEEIKHYLPATELDRAAKSLASD